MRPVEEVKDELVVQWLEKADGDLAAAESLLSTHLPHLWVIGFHAQQAVEKSLKTLLVHHQIEFPKTHKLGELFDLLAGAEPAIEESLREETTLNIRDPTDLPELTWEQAAEAVRLAGKVRDAVRSRLKG